jgi:very-short-patch-repair endonuclease
VPACGRVSFENPEHRVGSYRIDIVVDHGEGKRMAVECDGDRWHRIEDLQRDIARQEVLERVGWRFIRIRGSAFYRNPNTAMSPVRADRPTRNQPSFCLISGELL